MSIQDRYFEYADAFEKSYEDDDWSRLAQYFTEDASYDGGDEDTAHGRDAVLAKLEAAVNGMDRRMDSRKVDLSSPSATDDTVTVHPGMLAQVHRPDGSIAALHRVFLTSEGGIAAVPLSHKTTPAVHPGALVGTPIA